jgi:hypothetical protein
MGALLCVKLAYLESDKYSSDFVNLGILNNRGNQRLIGHPQL